MGQRRPFTITKVQRHPEGGHWTARVSCDGVTVDVDRRYGSWQANVRRSPGARSFARRFVLPHVAAELQRKISTAEAREAKQRSSEQGTGPARVAAGARTLTGAAS